MMSNSPHRAKQPLNPPAPFPWKCVRCGQKAVAPQTIRYEAERHYEGTPHRFAVESLAIPGCSACGEKIFTVEVDRQINAHFREQLHLLSPDQIRSEMDRLDLSSQELSQRLGIAVDLLNRWLGGSVIQPRAIDNLMRVFFRIAEVREALSVKTDGLVYHPSPDRLNAAQ